MATITVHYNNQTAKHQIDGNVNLMNFLRENGYIFHAFCGGHGICGKCRVILSADHDSSEVLSCKTAVDYDCEVYIPYTDSDISWNESTACSTQVRPRSGFGAAVDLGTTTVALSVFNLSDGSLVAKTSEWNIQRPYGSDVISRISHCMNNAGGLDVLKTSIQQQIADMLCKMCCVANISPDEISEICLSGNTVMQHLFAGISPVSIASSPYTPVSYFSDGKPLSLNNINVYMSPCVSGYVGGDITAGILSTGLHKAGKKSLLIDVGTNGEMALGNSDGITSCSVASGPAFEGFGISCGMPAEDGAIHKVFLTERGIEYEVLGDVSAKGFCGSGLLDIVACLLQTGILDETGRLEKDDNGDAVFHITDDVYINQKDIRQIQLAKAAVAAGIRFLIEAENVEYEDIEYLYLSGGFGTRLNPESAVRIGMLPAQMLSKIKSVGNTSLAGTEMALLSPKHRKEMIEIRNKCKYIELSAESKFNEYFVDEMFFPDEK